MDADKDVDQGMASNKFSYARQAVSACSYFMHDQLAGLGASSGWAGRIAFQLTKRTTHPSTHVRALQTTPAIQRQRYFGRRTRRGQVAFAFFKLGTPLLPSLSSSYRADQNGSSILYCTGTKSQPDIVCWSKCE